MRACVLLLLLWAAAGTGSAAPPRVVLIDDEFWIPASDSRFLPVLLRRDLAEIECAFEVLRGGSGVRVALLSREAYERFRGGRGHAVLAATSYVRRGRLRAAPDTAGEYGVLIDNRLEGRGPSLVRVELSLSFSGRSAPLVRELSPGRRAVVVIVSLLFLLAVGAYTAHRLRRASG